MNKLNGEVRYVKLASTYKDTKQFNESIGVGIRSVRERIGLSQSELAERANFCRNTIVQIELGKRERPIPLKTVHKILEVLAISMSLDDFFDLCKLPQFH